MIHLHRPVYSMPYGPVLAAFLVRLFLISAFTLGALGISSGPARALPVYSRQFGVACSACHTVAPRLNRLGYAFQANHFNWPGPDPKPRKDAATYLPVSTLTTLSYQHDFTGRKETTDFRSFELFLTSGLGIDHGRKGGYFIDLTAVASGGGTNGGLDNAYVALPLPGRRSQLALLVGQVTPLLYQYDPVNSLTDTIPYGISEGVNDFTFGGATPMIRLDYFDNRGKASADGNYASIGLPFHGHIELTRAGTVRAQSGLFAHAFHRWGFTTVGALGYVHKDSTLGGLIGTYSPRKNLYLTGVGTLAHDVGVNTTHLAIEAEYLPSTLLALSGRVELVGGDRSEVANVAAINYYPLKSQYLRLSAESRQRRADRAFTFSLRIQY